jgi:hypothetical protein
MTTVAPRSRRWVWYFVFLAVMGSAAITTPIVYNLSVQLRPEQVAAARDRWRAAGPRDYDLQFTQKTTRDGASEESEWKVKVRRGEVAEVWCDGQTLFPDKNTATPGEAVLYERLREVTVEGMFDRMEADLEKDKAEGQSRNYTMAVFDARDGHPFRYIRRVKSAGERLEWNFLLKPADDQAGAR